MFTKYHSFCFEEKCAAEIPKTNYCVTDLISLPLDDLENYTKVPRSNCDIFFAVFRCRFRGQIAKALFFILVVTTACNIWPLNFKSIQIGVGKSLNNKF